jgi:TPR repeat protein
MPTPNDLVRQVQAFAKAEAARKKLELDEYVADALKGDAEAMYAAAYEYSDSKETQRDIPHAITWYERAVQAGHPLAAHNLGWVHHNRGDSDQALMWFTRAAESGDRSAMSQLAMILEKESKSDADRAQAEAWFRKAASEGGCYHESYLAIFLHRSDPIGHAEEVVKLTLRSSEAGVSSAMYRHAEYLWAGTPVEQDRSKAEHVMRVLAGRGLENATTWLSDHGFERINKWDWIPKSSFGPVRLAQPVADYRELLELFVKEEDSVDEPTDEAEAFWDSAYYPELSVVAGKSCVVTVFTFYGHHYNVLYQGTELMGLKVEELHMLFDITDFVVEGDPYLSDAEISSAAYGVDFSIIDGEVVDLSVSLDAAHELWNEEIPS